MATTANTKAPAPRNRMMHINVRRPVGSQEDSMYVAVNGKTWQVRFNTPMMVPEVVYYTIKQSLRAENARDVYVEKLMGTNQIR